MRGIPNHPVTCMKCGSPYGFPSLRLCNNCKPVPVSVQKYFWTQADEEFLRRIYGENVQNKRQLGAALRKFAEIKQWPVYVLKDKAGKLGLSQDRRKFWTKAELQFLHENAGVKSIKFMQKKLNRGYNSITGMLSHIGLSYKVAEGYSQREIEQLLGVSARTVRVWVADGLLRPSRATGRIPEAALAAFIHNHPSEYRLKRVDEAWFKGMVFPNTFGIGRDAVSRPL